VRTRQAAGIGSRLELRVWVFAIAVLSAMVYGGRMREAKVFLRRTTRGSLWPMRQSISLRRAARPRRTEP